LSIKCENALTVSSQKAVHGVVVGQFRLWPLT